MTQFESLCGGILSPYRYVNCNGTLDKKQQCFKLKLYQTVNIQEPTSNREICTKFPSRIFSGSISIVSCLGQDFDPVRVVDFSRMISNSRLFSVVRPTCTATER